VPNIIAGVRVTDKFLRYHRTGLPIARSPCHEGIGGDAGHRDPGDLATNAGSHVDFPAFCRFVWISYIRSRNDNEPIDGVYPMNLSSLFRRTMLINVITTFCCIAWAGDVTWIDVRTPEEFAQKHVSEAVNIPYDQIGSAISELGLDKNQTIYLYCHSGRRAGIAKETLDALGYTRVVNIGGLTDALARVEERPPE